MSNGTAPAASDRMEALPRAIDRPEPAPAAPTASPSPPLLVAVDGNPAALRMATAIAQRDHEATELITVDEGFPRLRERKARTIAETARRCGARLIVMGLRPHRDPKALQDAEMAERVLRHATTPVLAVQGSAHELPRTAVAAIDFSRTGMRAALAALGILQRPATLYLVHVRPRLELPIDDTEGWGAAYETGVASTLARISDAWSGNGITVTGRVLSGGAAEQLLAFANGVSADLVTCGTHGHGVVERFLIGSIPRELLRAGAFSILVAPPDGHETRGGEDAPDR